MAYCSLVQSIFSVQLICGAIWLTVSAMADTNYIQYKRGTTNIILTVPHGGYMRPENVQTRDAGCWDPVNQTCIYVHNCDTIHLFEDYNRCWVTIGTDKRTINLTEYLSDAIYDLIGQRPHVIVNLLHRSRLDANRFRDLAAFDDPIAGRAWDEWYDFINYAKSEINGPGILFDIHAHIHREEYVELGYLISGRKLDNSDFSPEESSIRYLASRTDIPFDDLIRGEHSLGNYLQTEGYDTVPSITHPGPNGASYWYGASPGTNTMQHGSRDGGVVDAIQIETPESKLLYVEDVNITIDYAHALARAIVKFHEQYYAAVSSSAMVCHCNLIVLAVSSCFLI